jgi:gliding motility-associated-like protein
VTDANGCTGTAQIAVEEPATPVSLVLVGTDVQCFGFDNGEIQAVGSGGVQPYMYSINGGENWQGNDVFDGLGAGRYGVTVRDNNGCTFTDTLELLEPVPFVLTAAGDTTLEIGNSTLLVAGTNAVLPDTVVYGWQPSGTLSCSDCATPIATPAVTTAYIVTAVNSNGCVASDTVLVRVERVRRVYVANAFTPNGDNTNDVFLVQGGVGTQRVRVLRVWDRWGELVFESLNTALNDPSMGWNGTFRGQLMNSGVYAYYAEVEYIDGHVEVLKGDVTLLR